VVATLTFFLIHAAPGDPIDAMLQDSRVPQATRDALRVQYGLDQPVLVQYGRYLRGLAGGQLGFSLSQQRPVRLVMAGAVPATLLLMSTALLVSFAVGVGVGAAQGVRAGSRFDHLTSAVTTALATLPDFWLALGAMLLFAYYLHLLPVSGMVDP